MKRPTLGAPSRRKQPLPQRDSETWVKARAQEVHVSSTAGVINNLSCGLAELS
jgi:hypothetical protein